MTESKWKMSLPQSDSLALLYYLQAVAAWWKVFARSKRKKLTDWLVLQVTAPQDSKSSKTVLTSLVPTSHSSSSEIFCARCLDTEAVPTYCSKLSIPCSRLFKIVKIRTSVHTSHVVRNMSLLILSLARKVHRDWVFIFEDKILKPITEYKDCD